LGCREYITPYRVLPKYQVPTAPGRTKPPPTAFNPISHPLSHLGCYFSTSRLRSNATVSSSNLRTIHSRKLSPCFPPAHPVRFIATVSTVSQSIPVFRAWVSHAGCFIIDQKQRSPFKKSDLRVFTPLFEGTDLFCFSHIPVALYVEASPLDHVLLDNPSRRIVWYNQIRRPSSTLSSRQSLCPSAFNMLNS
jgi:hypothetical protein